MLDVTLILSVFQQSHWCFPDSWCLCSAGILAHGAYPFVYLKLPKTGGKMKTVLTEDGEEQTHWKEEALTGAAIAMM